MTLSAVTTKKASGNTRVGQPDKLTRLCMTVEYNGSRYYGFQFQTDKPTIQGELEEALANLTGDRLRVVAASRTDTGVHARGQVVSFRTGSSLSPETFVSGLNHYLPRDIAVKSAFRARDSFHVQHDAISREYDYCILNNQIRSPIQKSFCHLVTGELDTGAMNQAARVLIGEHDFASFATSIGRVRSTRRRVYQASVKRDGKTVVFNMVASSFLPHQVRNTVGALIRVGLGRMTADEFYSIMMARKPGSAGPTAPACGLCLMKVNYPAEECGENLQC